MSITVHVHTVWRINSPHVGSRDEQIIILKCLVKRQTLNKDGMDGIVWIWVGKEGDIPATRGGFIIEEYDILNVCGAIECWVAVSWAKGVFWCHCGGKGVCE